MDVIDDGEIRFEEGMSDEADWCGALEACEDLDFGGFQDWRLPNVRELQSVVDYSRWSSHPDGSLPMDPKFEGIASWYWSSSSNIDEPGLKYYVNFDIGQVRTQTATASRSVRCVRGGP